MSFEDDPVWDDISDECKDLLARLLQRDPKKRISSRSALKHAWLHEINIEQSTCSSFTTNVLGSRFRPNNEISTWKELVQNQ